MKMELFHFSSKKKKQQRAKDQTLSDMDLIAASRGHDDTGDTSESDLEKIVAGVSSNLSKTSSSKPSAHDSAVDIIVDSDEDEIFDDEDEDDAGDDEENNDIKSSNTGSSAWGASKNSKSSQSSAGVDYRDMLASSASAIVAPVQKMVNASGREEEDSQRTGDSYHSSHSESEEEEEEAEDTESEEEEEDEKANGKGGGNGSDSGEDYTDDEDEGEDGYRPGGYHPVKIGEVYNQR